MGAQAKVGAKDVAVLGAMLQEIDQRACQAHGERHRAVLAGRAKTRRVEQDDQVDIAGIIQLERAELAHAEHDHAARSHGVFGVAQRKVALFAELAQRKIESGVDCVVGKAAERFGHLMQRPDATDIGKRRQQGDPPPCFSQVSHQCCAATVGKVLGKDGVEDRSRSRAQKSRDDIGFGESEFGQKRTVAEQRGQ